MVVVLFGTGYAGNDGLMPVKNMDYTNDYPQEGFKIVCTHRGNREYFNPDGSDIAVGDRLVKDCRVVVR